MIGPPGPADALARLVLAAQKEIYSPFFLGEVMAITGAQVSVRPDSSADGTWIGPIAVVGATPSVGEFVLCARLGPRDDDAVICLGQYSSPPSGGGGGLTLLVSQTLSVAGSFDLTIPQTHDHLRIVGRLRSDESGTNTGSINARFNGVTSNVYARHIRETSAAGTSTISSGTSPQAQGYLGDCPAATALANRFASLVMEIPFYRGAFLKECLSRVGHVAGGSPYENTSAVLSFDSTAAITSIQIMPLGFNWIAGSRLDVYGY